VKPRAVLLRLSAMYFVQNLVWAAQLVLLSGHMDSLGFSGEQISYVFGTGALAAIVSPLIAGWVADRFFPGEIIAGISYLLCAPLLYFCWQQTEFGPLWWGMFFFSVIHAPTMALTNAVAFRHLEDLGKFGRIRVWGSIGWVGMTWCLSAYLRFWENWTPGVSHLGDGLLIAALFAALMGLYCFTLPHTPPSREGRNPYAFLEAFRLFRQRNFAVLLGSAFVIAATSPLVWNFSFIFLIDAENGPGMAPSAANWVLSLGQVMEIPVMLTLGFLLRRLGMRLTLFLGMIAQVVRAGALAVGEPVWMVVAAQTANGFFITFFFIASAMAVEQLARDDIRASAQGLLTFTSWGLGSLLGQFMAGRVYDYFTLADGSHVWGAIFAVPAITALVVAVVFVLLFRGEEDR
jgi:nucleoside transporter